MNLYLATGNPHKVEELQAMLKGTDCEVHSAKRVGGMPTVDESGRSFEANAELKARALLAVVPAGAWVLADDSGLEVDALDGAPGVYSARYAGAEASDAANFELLLNSLQGVPPKQRGARFRCALCLLDPSGRMTRFDGACEGTITDAPRGSEGFGYDPVFIPEGHKQTFGELGAAVKSRLSHRAAAVRQLREFIESRA